MHLPMRMRDRMLRLFRLAPRRPLGGQRWRAAIRHARTWSESSERGRYRWTIDRWPRELRRVHTETVEVHGHSVLLRSAGNWRGLAAYGLRGVRPSRAGLDV